MAKLLMGKEVSARIKKELREEAEKLKAQGINRRYYSRRGSRKSGVRAQ